MIVYEAGVEQKLPRAARPKRRELREFLQRARQATGLQGDVSVLVMDDAGIRRLNREFRRKDQATDVLSFPAPPETGAAGDLAISLETAARQAVVLGHPVNVEMKVLLLHGLLHLAGYDHETDDGEMRRRETRLRRELDLPAGLIERTSPPKATRKAAGR